MWGIANGYHYENGKVSWSMASTPAGTTRIWRCHDSQTYEARLVAGTLAKPIPDRRSEEGAGIATEPG